MRLDLYLTNNGFFDSRNKAQDEIKKGNIEVDGKVILKPNFDVIKPNIKVLNQMPYVSRGGYKLEEAIKAFNLDFKDKVVLDIGASTGGFTDCALLNGARLVYSVDVGSNQLALKLRNDKRVISYENTNILDLKLDINPDILVMDVSFVSIEHLIDGIKRFLNQNNYLIALIKPQFEVGKMINKGVIKDKKVHIDVLNMVSTYLNNNGLYINKLTVSPIKGGSGNIEFLSMISLINKGHIDILEVVEKAHRKG